MKRHRTAERTNGRGQSASKTVTLGHTKSDTKTELRSESSKDEEAVRLEAAKEEFATISRRRRYPGLVERSNFRGEFLEPFRKHEQRDPDGPAVDCWDVELLEAGTLPKPAKLGFNKEALNEEIRAALEGGFDQLAAAFAEGASAEELGLLTALLNRHGGRSTLELLNDLLLCGQEGAAS